MLHHLNKKGWWYDWCFRAVCPTMKIAVDYSMVAYHAEKVPFNLWPLEARQASNLTYRGASRHVADGYYNPEVPSQGKFLLNDYGCKGSSQNTYYVRYLQCSPQAQNQLHFNEKRHACPEHLCNATVASNSTTPEMMARSYCLCI
jgi:hypothetical protein